MGERYAQLEDGMLLMLGGLPGDFIERSNTSVYSEIQKYLAKTQCPPHYSALVVKLKQALVDDENITDEELDVIIESGNFRLDQYNQSARDILSDSNVDGSGNIRPKKRKRGKKDIPSCIDNDGDNTNSLRSTIPGTNPINALLNPAAVVGNSSVQIASGHGQDSTAYEQTEIESSLELQAMMGDSCLSQPSSAYWVEKIEKNMAVMANVYELNNTLGQYFFAGIEASDLRKQEKKMRRDKYTGAVRLKLPWEGEDFKLEICLSKLVAIGISQAMRGSGEELRDMLGTHIFEAIKTSNRWKEQERDWIQDFSRVLRLSFPGGDIDDDCKLEVVLGYEFGWNFYKRVFPGDL